MSVFFDVSGIAFRAVHNKILSLNIVISKVLRKTVIQTYLFVKYEYYDSITCVALPGIETSELSISHPPDGATRQHSNSLKGIETYDDVP
jgi:hypothetical protein